MRPVGVFKKGKASLPSKVGESKVKKIGILSSILLSLLGILRCLGGICFSESQFLKGAALKSKRKREPSLSISSSSNESVSPEKRSQRKVSSRVESDIVEESSDVVSVPPPASTRKPYNPANSIVWDIERDSYVEESEVNTHQGTVVISFPFLQRKSEEPAVQDSATSFSPECKNVCLPFSNTRVSNIIHSSIHFL